MGFLTRMFAMALTGIVIGWIGIYIFEKNSKELINSLKQEHVVLHLPSIFFWVGFLDIIFCSTCLFIMFFFPNGTEAWWVWTEFILFILLGLALVLKTLIFKIDVYKNKDYFVYRSVFVKTRKIYYCECISYQCTQYDLIVKTGKKKITIDIHTVNVEFLMGMLGKNKVKQIR